MNRDSSFDERVTAWLADEAPVQVPDRVVRAIFERTRTMPQAWTLRGGRRRIEDSRFIGLGVAAAGLIVVLVVGGLFRPPSGPGSATPSPTTGPSPARPSLASIPTSRIPAITGLPGRFAFSRPNTRSAVLEGSSDIWVMNPDRMALQQLTTGAGGNREPAWSPDGTRIAFVSNRDGRNAIWIMNADGTGQTRVTPAEIDNAVEPAWSPDGSTIAFSRGSPDRPDEANGVYRIDVDGSNLRPLLLVGQHEMTFASEPLWSPDGATLLVRGELDLFLIGVDGTNFRNLTNTPTTEDAAGSWSPDGQWIAFEGDQGGGCILRIKPDGTGLDRLTTGCSQGFSMSWSPDSSRLAFAGGPHFLADISVIAADGSNLQQLTDTRDIAELSWGR